MNTTRCCVCGRYVNWRMDWCSDTCAKEEKRRIRKRLTHISAQIDAVPQSERLFSNELEELTKRMEYIRKYSMV